MTDISEQVTFPTRDMDKDWVGVIPADYIIYAADVWGIESGDLDEMCTFDDSVYVMERTAHYISRLINYVVRGSLSSEISIPNAAVKLFAPKFINEKGEVKTGEIFEIQEVEGRSVAERLDEAADIVGKYALGIDRVAKGLSGGEDTKWDGFSRDLSTALGFHFDDVLAAFVVKYDQRFQHGKDKAAEFKRVEGIVKQRNVRTLDVQGSLSERINQIRERYDLDAQMEIFRSSDSKEADYSLKARQSESTVEITVDMLIACDKKNPKPVQSFSGSKQQMFSYHEAA